MKIDKLSGNNRTWYRWTSCIAAGVLTAALAACGGGDGDTTVAAAPPAGGGATTPATAAASITTAAALAANDTATAPTAVFSVVQSAGIVPVTVASPPKVNFTVISDGAVVKDLTTANARFILAKLVPGTNGAPDQWVNYVSRTETATPTVGPGGKAALVSATQSIYDSAAAATQLAYNDAGYYTYTFTTDIKDTTKTNGVTFEPTLTHRITAWMNYKNKAGQTVRVNPYFDFTIDANGNAVAVTGSAKTRKVVDISSCNECHSKLGMHGGGAVDTQGCVACHNAGLTDANSGNLLDLRVMVHRIHAGEHAKELFGKDYTIWGYGDTKFDFSEVTYPQPLANCVKCHDGAKKDAAGNQLAAQGDNWKTKPSRAACGACHAGVDFAKNTGVTWADAEAGKTSSSPAHIGGVKTDDSQCAICHTAADIPVYHVTVDRKGSADRGGYPVNTAANTPTPGFPAGQGPSIPLQSQINSPAGVYKMDFEIKQVTVTGAAGAKKATVVYRILKDGSPVTLNATGALITGLDGSPNVMLTYAVPQDGIASPADWNVPLDLGGGARVIDIRDGKNGHSQTGPDASGFYTATLGNIIPDNAKMVTAAMPLGYQGFVQLNHPEYPNGIRLRESKFVMKTADGDTARRSVVDGDKCNKCHGQLGVSPSFHSGSRNNGAGCALCHNPNRATGHVGAAYGFGGGWFVGAKNLVHSIHASAKRAQVFNYLKDEGTKFEKVTYPGILKNCEACHLTGTYDYSAQASKDALPNLLWATDTAKDMTNNATTNPTGIVPIAQNPWVKLIGPGEIDYRTDNLVSSPIASACFGCHDSSLAVQHMQSNGGTLLKQFSTVASVATRPAVGVTSTMTFTKRELCMDCHVSTSTYGLGIKAVHAK